MSIRPFEREIINRFGTYGKAPDRFTGRRGWKGVWIRGHLSTVRQDYPYGMYINWVIFCNQAKHEAEVIIKPGTYQSFRTYFYALNKLGLVTLYAKRRKESGEPGSHKHIYVLTPGMEADPRWESPLQELYPSTDWTTLSAKQKHERRVKYSRRRHPEAE
jgi:hypothetical protein